MAALGAIIGMSSQAFGACVFGGIGLLYIMVLIMLPYEEFPPFKVKLLAVFTAIVAALFGFFFTGTIAISIEPDAGGWGRSAIQAGGGMALFVIVLWYFWSDSRSRNKHVVIVLPEKETPRATGRKDSKRRRIILILIGSLVLIFVLSIQIILRYHYPASPTVTAPNWRELPEPATMSLLGLGGLALLRKRRNRNGAR